MHTLLAVMLSFVVAAVAPPDYRAWLQGGDVHIMVYDAPHADGPYTVYAGEQPPEPPTADFTVLVQRVNTLTRKGQVDLELIFPHAEVGNLSVFQFVVQSDRGRQVAVGHFPRTAWNE